MRLVLPVVLLGVAVLAMSQKKREGGYADSWAVEVRGGETKARELADKHGFVYRGKVGSLKDMYHFELPDNGGEHSPHKTRALEAEDMVHYVEQQIYRQMAKKRPF
ncbi:Proprotein convertase subtilisin/kexin type 5 [Geodia barretti]|uniref:Proprotein convertase subtilisin/kexin type 5 n=1 Tax=Geodia barretti TaxID=519541 RepID=A0AA35R147_GEOBA|nr:Proprotein convertase subtilisin/kexin type 5 [Geodia barretti]